MICISKSDREINTFIFVNTLIITKKCELFYNSVSQRIFMAIEYCISKGMYVSIWKTIQTSVHVCVSIFMFNLISQIYFF